MPATVTPITGDILQMDSEDHMVRQAFPAIEVIDDATYRRGDPDNTPRFTVAANRIGRMGIFACSKDGDERSVILAMPDRGTVENVVIGVSHGFGQNAHFYGPRGWSNPRSRPLIEFVILKHVVNRWGAQVLASGPGTALLHIVRGKGKSELGPFASDGPFVRETLEAISELTNGAMKPKKTHAFTFSSGIYDFLRFLNGVSGHVPLQNIINIDPSGMVSAPRLNGATMYQYSRAQRGHPGFEYLPLRRWANEKSGLHDLKKYGARDYIHNWCMPKYILHLALRKGISR